jgi:DNA segregation ATPase FtsK/SpoIIIE, S-DNA-T family
LPIAGNGLTIRVGGLITEVTMPVGAIEREIGDACARLAEATAMARHCHEHYLDDLGGSPGAAGGGRGLAGGGRGLAGDGRGLTGSGHGLAGGGLAGRDLTGTVTALTTAHPWALDGFGEVAWDHYQPDPGAPAPDGLRVGLLRAPGGPALPLLPAVARFARHGHVLISERGFADGARSLLQALVLRLATATRPGTVRFALADPVGQGRHLSAFLRLPALLRVGTLGGGVAARSTEIEALLTRLTDHVVEVTQQRLTNVYDSVEAYNAATTGVLVPYHVLVLAGFPAGFSDQAAELLASLARNGPRAGLYILATVDPGQAMPRGFDLPTLTALSTNLGLDAHGDLSWDDPDFGRSAIEPDQMPAAARANPWLDAVGAAASSAARELPFSRIAVGPEQLWAGVSADGLDVQIGVDGKGEPQRFVMGVRGVHHGLVGGDVRMGKTNLLHVLISQLALCYPPEELELYLLDFKEVEFDAYLTERLPHARAITSRTDREFGLSMLRRFHDEINRRARLCREAKVTDLPDYRQATGRVLPRALVIMDEFQVLFSEEDRLAREAGRLLADIAKRGAAFGLHLLLATQSPGGPLAAYLRPVYEQMALRIALGCTQPSVSQAILGEGNDAATRLAQAGDAIYNDRRGEGDNPVMRIAMLPTRERLALIAAIRALGDGREYPAPASFDPDAPADFAAHGPCAAFAAAGAAGPAGTAAAAGAAGAAGAAAAAGAGGTAPAAGAGGTAAAAGGPERWPAPGATVAAWLGEAIEIKPATTATFERYVRSNLLIVGSEDHGPGLLLATVLSAAVQRSPADVCFTIAEFTRPSAPSHDFFAPLHRLPHQVLIADRRTAGAALDDLLDDLDARLAESDGATRPERFFLIAGLHRWHELLAEGDYGRASETSARLVRLADKGPDAGIHVVAWADGYATTERALRRTGLAHFGLRAVLRVLTPAESDSLLGVSAAASLDDDRALYRDTEWPAEQVEKFKPYSVASLYSFARTAFGNPA